MHDQVGAVSQILLFAASLFPPCAVADSVQHQWKLLALLLQLQLWEKFIFTWCREWSYNYCYGICQHSAVGWMGIWPVYVGWISSGRGRGYTDL